MRRPISRSDRHVGAREGKHEPRLSAWLFRVRVISRKGRFGPWRTRRAVPSRKGRDGVLPTAPAVLALPKPQSWIVEMRVAQLLRAPRVPPHWNSGAVKYWARVHECAMYSDAIQIVLPSADAAP